MKRILIIQPIDFIIKKAKELGYITILISNKEINPSTLKYVDYFKIIDYGALDVCLKYAKEMNIDGVLAASEPSVITASYIAKNLNLSGIDLKTARLVRSKFEMQEKLSSNNINAIPQHFLVRSVEEIEDTKDMIDFPVIVKPNDGLGSIGVFKANNINELIEKVTIAINNSATNTALIETFIEGSEYGVESFVYNNQVYVLGITKKLMTPPPYHTELGHIIPSGLSYEMENKIKALVENIINTLEIKQGSVNMDILITNDNSIYLIDLGARHGGNGLASHLIPFITNTDYLANIIKLAMGEEIEDFKIDTTTFAMVEMLELSPGKIIDLPDFTRFYDNNVIDIVFKLAVGDTIKTYINSSTLSGYLVVTGDSVEDMMDKARQLEKKIDRSIVREQI